MVIVFEISKPYHVFKVEKLGNGAMTRVIWAWFSIAFYRGEFNDIARVIRADERKKIFTADDNTLQKMAEDPDLEKEYARSRIEYMIERCKK